MGIGGERRLPLRKFSKGMLQRVGLAQALINEPEVVFLDEPMSGLDPLGRRDVRALILELRDRGCTVFFSSHILSDAEALCSRVGIIVGGQLVTSGSPLGDPRVRGVRLGTRDGRPRPRRRRGARERRAQVTRISEGRYTIEVAAEAEPERLVGDLRAQGRAVRLAQPAARDARGLFRPAGDGPQSRAAGRAGNAGGMMGRVIGLVAYHVFKESVRDKVLYNLVLFAVLMIAASYLIGQLTAGQDVKIIKDLGLAASAVFGLFIAVFIGVGLVWKEVDRRSVYNLLVKPLRRHEFIIGKFLGLALTLLVNIAVMAAALYVVLALMNWLQPGLAKASVEAPVLDPQLLKAFALLYVQLLVVTSVALFFSTFSGPMLSAAFTFGLYIVGHFNADLAHFEDVVKSPAAGVARQGAVLPPAQPGAVRREGGRRARPAGVRGVRRADVRVRPPLRRRDDCAGGPRLLAAGLQVAMSTPGRSRAQGRSAARWRSSRRLPCCGSPRCRCRRIARRGTRRRRSATTSSTSAAERPCSRAALGFDAILADVYWIRAIQHFGGTRRSEGGDKSYKQLYPLLDLTTTLDPRFTIAYRFGAIFLAEPYPAARAGPTRPSPCSSGAWRPTRRDGSTRRTPGSSTTGGGRTTRRPRSGSTAPRASRARHGGCDRWRPPRWPKAATVNRRASCGSSSTTPPTTTGSGTTRS